MIVIVVILEMVVIVVKLIATLIIAIIILINNNNNIKLILPTIYDSNKKHNINILPWVRHLNFDSSTICDTF